jgi:hypothetical protein
MFTLTCLDQPIKLPEISTVNINHLNRPMKTRSSLTIALLIGLLNPSLAQAQTDTSYRYKPKSQALYDTIVHLDSVYFNAYNTCDMDKQAALFADSIEFYHDGGGLETSKQKLLTALKNNICGKVSRVLVKGSIEVYEIPGYGAVEIALHHFINHAENNSLSKPDRFIIVWRHKNNEWQMTRVISLHMAD